ncbi:flagellar hook-basal body complex protein FliE [Ferriphaselus sp. R-1]|uniref:flagellar hook-basal body complex protein FliE n=1 Tax=Ferriphaselus sp. R-1 TaxID=1485544 RepID=UPI000551D7B2|nr:flagellar hook-basal body complex protein FliE [Ferriphaselus sp. R-1]
MNVSGVDNLLAQMRTIMAQAQGGVASSQGVGGAGQADFASALKAQLDGVSSRQHVAEDMQKAFVLGDDKVSLSDTMIAMQKANVAFQTTVQVRNKVVAAYNDIMNMQV